MLQRMEISQERLVRSEEGNVLVFVNPDEIERQSLISNYKLDEHTLASALDPNELARLESEPDHVAIILKIPQNYSSEDQFFFRVGSVGVFLFADKLIIVGNNGVPAFQGKVFAKIGSLSDLLLKMIYNAILHFVDHLRAINTVTDSLEDQINSSMQNKYLLNLFSLEKSLVYYQNAINSNSKLIEKLRYTSKIVFTDEQLEFVDDLIIENTQCYEQTSIYANVLAGMMDARASIVSNNLNWLMKTFTTITIAIMLPTFVTSLFSMNVDFPGKNYPHMFWIIAGLAFCSVVMVRVIWWWKKW